MNNIIGVATYGALGYVTHPGTPIWKFIFTYISMGSGIW